VLLDVYIRSSRRVRSPAAAAAVSNVGGSGRIRRREIDMRRVASKMQTISACAVPTRNQACFGVVWRPRLAGIRHSC